MTASRWRRHPVAPLVVVAAGYAVSRAVLHLGFGIAFDASTLGWFWQYVDPALLRDDPWASLYYLHAQPPLYNFYLAAVVGSASGDPAPLFGASYLLFGLALHVGLYALLVALGVRTRVAVFGALLFALCPAGILYESWLFYTYPLAALLVLATLAVHRLARRGALAGDALLFFGLLAAAALTRSLFHVLWIAVVAAGVIVVLREHRRRLLFFAALPIGLVLAVHAKNALEFGSFTTSSWLGMNVARLTLDRLPASERERLIADGVLSEAARLPAFAAIEQLPDPMRRVDPGAHPVLREERKSTRAVNYNHVAYLALSRAQLRDALALIRHDPLVYLSSVGDAWLLFGMPPSEYWFLDRNRARIEAWDRAWNAVVYGVRSAFGSDTVAYDRQDRAYLLHRVSVTWIAVAIVSLGFGLVRGGRDVSVAGRDRARGLALLFMATTVLYVACVGNALEYRENNRFRFLVEPLVWVLAIMWLDRLWRTGGEWLRRLRQQPGS